MLKKKKQGRVRWSKYLFFKHPSNYLAGFENSLLTEASKMLPIPLGIPITSYPELSYAAHVGMPLWKKAEE